MTTPLADFDIRKWKIDADWKLLMLLLLFLNVKLAIKIPAIVLIYLWQFDFRFGFRLKNSRLPLFYLLAIALSLVAMLVNGDFQTPGYPAVLLTGIVFWVLCILTAHQAKLSVEKHDPAIIHKTLLIFFILNAAVSAFNILLIIWETGEINPYQYQGEFQKYFLSTGDYIKGITFDTSTTNAIINAIGALYFLTRKNSVLLLVCVAALLLTGSNFINIILLLVLGFIFVFKSNRDQKSMIVICLALLVTFMAKVSPQNNRYVSETIEDTFEDQTIHKIAAQTRELPIAQRPDSVLNPEEKRIKFATLYLDSLSQDAFLRGKREQELTSVKPIIRTEEGTVITPQADIHSATYQSIKVPLAAQQPLLKFVHMHKRLLPVSSSNLIAPTLPGKVLAMQQTGKFYTKNPGKLLIGNGMGNFSSKLAFRATGLGIAGGFPEKYVYINPDFMQNHLDIYLNFFSKHAGFHSLTNSPFSVYDQLISEYGLLGLLAFAIFYWGFFAKHYKKLTYGLPILLLITAALFIDYWFEQLSVLVLFELMLMVNIKENSTKPALAYEHN